MRQPLRKRVVAEALGTFFLLAAVAGSGIMGERLAGGNTALALLANTLATGAALAALILTFGPLSGAHFNPVVSAAVAAANAMFGGPAFSLSRHVRTGPGQLLSEAIATFGLLVVISGCARHK